EHADDVHAPRQVAIQQVRNGRARIDERRQHAVFGGAAIEQQDHDRDCEDAPESQQVGQVQGVLTERAPAALAFTALALGLGLGVVQFDRSPRVKPKSSAPSPLKAPAPGNRPGAASVSTGCPSSLPVQPITSSTRTTVWLSWATVNAETLP